MCKYPCWCVNLVQYLEYSLYLEMLGKYGQKWLRRCIYIYMVGGIPTPLKNMKVSWDHVQYISCIFDGCLLDLVFHVYIHWGRVPLLALKRTALLVHQPSSGGPHPFPMLVPKILYIISTCMPNLRIYLYLYYIYIYMQSYANII